MDEDQSTPESASITIPESEWNRIGELLLALGDAVRTAEDAESGIELVRCVLKDLGRHYNTVSNRLAGIED